MKEYAIGLYEKAMLPTLSWREKLAFAKEAGYDFVEISIDEKDEKLARLDWTREERLELVRTMYEVGLPIRSMCLSGHRKYPFGSADPEIRRRSMEIMEKAIILADDLGIRIILRGLHRAEQGPVPGEPEKGRRDGRRAGHHDGL